MNTVVGYDFIPFSGKWAVVEQRRGRWARRVMGIFRERAAAEGVWALLSERLAEGRELPVYSERDQPWRRGRPRGSRL